MTERMVPAWPSTAGGGKPGSSVLGQLGVRFAELLGRRDPARAHDEGDVVAVDAGQLSQPLRGPVGVGVRV